MPRRAASSGSTSRGRRRPREDEDEDEEVVGDVPSDDSADSDFVADTEEEEAADDEDDYASDGDGAVPAAAAAAAPAVAQPPPPPVLLRPKRQQAGKGRGGRKKGARDDGKPPLPWEVWEDANEKWLDEREGAAAEGEPSEAAVAAVPTAEPAPEVLLPLLRFQKEWLAWALAQEAGVSRGGILADEMGMGKTIQGISLVLTARRLRPPAPPPRPASSSSRPLDQSKRWVGCTLVVCPVVAVIQWAQEIERHTAKDSVRVLVYHGGRRGAQKYDFNKYDFVITTYSTIEADYRKHIMPPKIRCEYCDKLFYPNKLKVHLKYYCGPDAQRTKNQAKQESKKGGYKKGTWKRTVQKKKNGSDGEDFEECDEGQSRGQSPLHSVRWERIILDEAHFIKDRRCNTAKAIFALESEYKWALSGTPLQNRVGELYSLIRFLQIFPYSNYFCKDCNCEILDTLLKKQCDCGHSSVRHFCWWNKHIARPIQFGSASREGKRAMVLLKEKVLKGIVLRRTKKGRAADLALPPKIVTLRRDSFDKNEMEFYEALYTQSRTQFASYVDAGTLMNNYAHIFDLLTRLRQAVDHPYLVAFSKTAELGDRSKNEGNEESQCGMCHNLTEDAVVTSCEHVFCKNCLIDYSATLGNVSCPSCSVPLTVDLTTRNSGEKVTANMKGGKRSGILGRIQNLADFKTSTKIDALREEVRNMVEHDGSAKGIVFSQFTSFLDLIEFSLQKSGIKCVQLNGKMNIGEKGKAIDTFTNDPDCRIFLMSLKAGGVALNLTVASHVFLMDPWWNPAVESQAQDRIHRIGQFKPIRSMRFVIKDTVEERILQLQEKKRLVFEGTVGDSPEAMSKLTEADLKFLFQN
ncbi:hypothetical protein E2562_028607 [Oryza meyeriana var. granulata]|uniref:DNA repair protein RAD16 n=1 Tax=Oryza meyeriana var. granulata TaxID=110450 RepID=A0A6G1D7T0_9ORYZ|nr:hypothetical protein E2562_028607 [Oryza meyeriana var. granulata]